MKTQTILIAAILTLVLTVSITPALALTVGSVSTPTLSPGEEGIVNVEVENNLNQDAKDVSISLNFENVPFVAVGSSSASVDKINDDDEEDFTFKIKAANNIQPGDYSIPYTLDFEVGQDKQTRTGTLGVTVSGKTDLDFTVSLQNPVIDQQGQVTLRIINKEFGDAKFVLVKVFPDGFTLLSEDEIYIGNIDSDDFETATFDVIFTSQNPKLIARVEYKDFNNKNVVETVDLPFIVYSRERALELGLIQKNNTTFIFSVIVTAILAFILYRILRKRARLKRSMAQNNTGAK